MRVAYYIIRKQLHTNISASLEPFFFRWKKKYSKQTIQIQIRIATVS